MRRIVLAFQALLVVTVLGLAACGSSKATNTPAQNHAPTAGGAATTVARTPASVQPGGTARTTSLPAATTPCTIPQNNGGDHDADNNGGPSDGDGCDR
jgi:hypothetical protein